MRGDSPITVLYSKCVLMTASEIRAFLNPQGEYSVVPTGQLELLLLAEATEAAGLTPAQLSRLLVKKYAVKSPRSFACFPCSWDRRTGLRKLQRSANLLEHR